MRRSVSLGKRRLGPLVAARSPRRVDLPLDRWGLSVGPAGTLELGGHSLPDLARTWGTPLHVVDLERLGADADAALAPHRAGSGADVFFSYKTNPVPGVLAALHRRGVGAEVISAYELWLALRLGVSPDRIIYNGPAKSEESIRSAIRSGIALINANSLGDLQRIVEVAHQERTPVNLGLRVSVAGAWSGQFGIPSGSEQLHDAVAIARSAPHVRLVGLHAHRGGTIRSVSEWEAHVSAVLEVMEALRCATSWEASVIDLGGSLPCPSVAGIGSWDYRMNRAVGTDLHPPSPESAISIADASETAVALVRAWAAGLGVAEPDVYLEPGRALTSSSQLMLVSVLDVKDDVEPVHVVIDAGSNLADPLPHEYHQLFSASAPTGPPARSYRLVGPICTPADVLYENWTLPDLQTGHVLAIMDTGAYFVPFSNSFSFPQPAIVGVDGAGVRELRRRETFDDLVVRDASRDVDSSDVA